MSSILKALEKVEEAQSGRRSGAASGFIKQRQRRAAWVLPVGILSGAIVAAVATFAAMGGFSRHQAPAPQSAGVVKAEPVAAAPVAPAVAPTQPVAVPQPASATARGVGAPAAVTQAAAPVKAVAFPHAAPRKVAEAHPAKPTSVSSAKGARSVAAKAKPANSREAKAVASARTKTQHKSEKAAKAEKSERKVARAEQHKGARSERPVHARVQSLLPQPVAVNVVAPPAPAPAPVAVAHAVEKSRPQVTGIAWQNDSASSVAMVNGRSVQQGATVDGYKVEQIFEDKVRFSSSSGRVEVPLGAGQ